MTEYAEYATVALLELATGTSTSRYYCRATDTWYRYEALGGSYTRDGLRVLNTGTAGNTRFLGTDGQYPVTYLADPVAVLGPVAVNMGENSPSTKQHIAETITTSPRGPMSSQHNTGTHGAQMHLRKSRGTQGIPVIVVTGDVLAKVIGEGFDGSDYLEMGAITVESEGTVAATRIPTKLVFYTATDATPSVLTARMIIDSAGAFKPVVTNTYTLGTASLVFSNAFLTAMNLGGKSVTMDDGPPASGTQAVGDMVINSAPTSGGVWAWTCVTAGTPGTFEPIIIGM